MHGNFLTRENANNPGNMRYTSSQEDGCGAGLPQDKLPVEIDESMMAASEMAVSETDTSTEEGSMVSNLPLLFANGYPTSLEKITLEQLERFITFMVQCSLGHDNPETISEPQWWPKEVQFSNPLVRPKKFNDSWMANLKKLVFRCYTYHRSEYLLRFCSYLARYPHEDLEYVNNWDATTSLYHKTSSKLLVTFRNENMNYDKRNDSPRKKLLSHNAITSNFANKSKQQHTPMMVQRQLDDIYLCENCDGEFIGLEKMKEHERICCSESEQTSSNSRPATPDVVPTGPELQQDQFLEYFRLLSRNKDRPISVPIAVNKTVMPTSNIPRRTSSRIRGSINLTRCPTIPISSPAGILLTKKSKTMTEETQQERLDRIERHALAPPLTASCRPKWLDRDVDVDRWIVTYKPNREKLTDEYIRYYRFNSFKNKPILSIRSQLLFTVCRPLRVILKRLSKDQIEELKRDSSKYNALNESTPLYKKAGPASKTLLKLQEKLSLDIAESSGHEAPNNETAPVMAKDEKYIAKQNSVENKAATIDNLNTNNDTLPKIKQGTTVNPKSTIMLIDLCSSDEEDSREPLSSDENRDPLNTVGNEFNKTLMKKHTPSKLCSKPCIYSTDSNSDWLMDNVLSNDGENWVNKYRGNVVLNTCTQISPILRPAP